jgi:hypothetical protein
MEDVRGRYIEVQTKTGTFTCDADCIPLIESYTWTIRKKYNYVIGKQKGKGVVLHRMLFPYLEPTSRVVYHDGDRLNNRRYNLIIKH